MLDSAERNSVPLPSPFKLNQPFRSTLPVTFAKLVPSLTSTHDGLFIGGPEVTGAELKQLREDLGEAIGRPLSVGDMATLCGLPPETGPATIVKWEAGAGPNGPVAALLSLIAVGCDRYPLGEEIISAGDAELFPRHDAGWHYSKAQSDRRRLSVPRDPGSPDSFKQRRLHLTACQSRTRRRPP